MSKTKQEKKPISKAKKIYNVLSTIVTAAIFIFLLFIVVIVVWQKASGKDSSLFGYYMYDVLSESMQPTIDKGDVILCKKVDTNTLKEGDIITFTAPSGSLKGYNETHRIFKIVRKDDGSIDFIKTAGDNKYGGDEIKVDGWNLNPSAVKAVYVRSLPTVAAIRSFLLKPAGFIVLIVLPLLAVFVLVIVGYVKDRTKLEKERLKEEREATPINLDSLDDAEKQKLLDEYIKNNSANSGEIDNSTDGKGNETGNATDGKGNETGNATDGKGNETGNATDSEGNATDGE
ncbi:MAG: signal peptidase I, partial [Clostridia bacterium]